MLFMIRSVSLLVTLTTERRDQRLQEIFLRNCWVSLCQKFVAACTSKPHTCIERQYSTIVYVLHEHFSLISLLYVYFFKCSIIMLYAWKSEPLCVCSSQVFCGGGHSAPHFSDVGLPEGRGREGRGTGHKEGGP